MVKSRIRHTRYQYQVLYINSIQHGGIDTRYLPLVLRDIQYQYSKSKNLENAIFHFFETEASVRVLELLVRESVVHKLVKLSQLKKGAGNTLENAKR